MKRLIIASCFTLAITSYAMSEASAWDRNGGKNDGRGYDRPYGNSLDNGYQDDYYDKKKEKDRNIFQRELYDDSDRDLDGNGGKEKAFDKEPNKSTDSSR